ncbi:hypothetical protein BCR43DRAFT_492812 [Syncephalastrum racemosum]|uniref:Extracellular membrane protein CFEM domain-containing protein n=1 Tax=Syncephalastrum racemosum TaxID=13706 RepID=A0A1X2H9L9_SYNRA|nr:hypothetical protein BCR43DRAFT_492812 [Syncephalastrum racemosum]
MTSTKLTMKATTTVTRRRRIALPLILLVLLNCFCTLTAAVEPLHHTGLCTIADEDSTACADACEQVMDGNGICIYDTCYCTDVGIGSCEDYNHEGCDAICQEMSSNLIGFCNEGQCNCLS